MRLTIPAVLVLLLLAAHAPARDIYVSNLDGNDRNDGTGGAVISGRGPVRSISRALTLAAAGDRILIANTGQPYRETLSLVGSRHGGSVHGPLVIEGQGAVLDGSVEIPAERWQHERGATFSYQPARLGYQQLFLDGFPAIRRPATWSSSAPPRLEPQQWCYWRGRIYFCVDPGRGPQDYRLACCGLQTGITLYYVDDVVIRDLAVQGFQLDGVAVHDVVHNARLAGVACRANGQCGVSVRGASWVELDDCTLSGNGVAQLRVANFARVWLYGCELASDTAPAIERQGRQVMIEVRRRPVSPSLPATPSP